jgi:hypothetical protein
VFNAIDENIEENVEISSGDLVSEDEEENRK